MVFCQNSSRSQLYFAVIPLLDVSLCFECYDRLPLRGEVTELILPKGKDHPLELLVCRAEYLGGFFSAIVPSEALTPGRADACDQARSRESVSVVASMRPVVLVVLRGVSSLCKVRYFVSLEPVALEKIDCFDVALGLLIRTHADIFPVTRVDACLEEVETHMWRSDHAHYGLDISEDLLSRRVGEPDDEID